MERKTITLYVTADFNDAAFAVECANALQSKIVDLFDSQHFADEQERNVEVRYTISNVPPSTL